MKFLRTTPVLIVEQIEAELAFWQQGLGYEKVVEVPHGEALGFVLLVRDGQEVMLQSRANVTADMGTAAPHLAGQTVIEYVEVDSLEELLGTLEPAAVIVPERTTFYGMREVFVKTPGGHVFGFAQKIAPDGDPA